MLHRGVNGTYWMNDPTQSPRTLLDNTLDACRRALCARSSVRRLTFGARTLPRAPKYNRSMVDAALLAEAKRLSPDDRLELISALWQSLSPDQLPVTDAEKLNRKDLKKSKDFRLQDGTYQHQVIDAAGRVWSAESFVRGFVPASKVKS